MNISRAAEPHSPASRLRELLAGGDARALAEALAVPAVGKESTPEGRPEASEFSETLRLRMLREMPGLTAAQRILLRDPSRAEDFLRAGDEAQREEDASRAEIEKWLFKAGAAHPFLRERLAGTEIRPDAEIRDFGTDGLAFYYRGSRSEKEAEDLKSVTYEDFQHILMHCVFRHMIPPEKVFRPLWDLACDLSAEYLRADFFPGVSADVARLLVRGSLPAETDPRLPGSVYRALMDLFSDEITLLSERVMRDDHRYWYERPAGAEDTVEEIERRIVDLWAGSNESSAAGTQMTHRFGLTPGSREEKMLLRTEAKYDFSRYLRRFSTTREEIRLDLDGFDCIPYYYGLKRYGNMPLVEPLEYTESHKVEDLVIAIDTSGSCTQPVVARFLAEIERVLMRREYFFREMNVHMIQCDSIIQSHAVIHSQEEWKAYAKDLTIRGRGGTNFTPVFELVEKLRAKGELRHLKGLLYFTDGDGVYPQEETPYETAFVFTTRDSLKYGAPEWAVKLCLDMTKETIT